jgi:type III secretory pathway lipoprotein EscJ
MDAHHSLSHSGRRPFVSPAQVIALGLVAASVGWAAWLLRDRPIREETELLAGSVLPSSELAIMEAAFDRAQLTDYRTEGGKVYVPRSRQSAYMRALVDAEALPREFGGSLRRALANNSPWQSRAVQAEVLRVATQDELSLVLCSMPGIERAAVLYDVEEQTGLGGGTVKTASVSIRTQPDAELDATRVQAIRVLVAASIAGLSAERVAVTDLRSGRVFVGPLEEEAAAAADPALGRKLVYERTLASKVRQSLAFVKGAIVDVTIAFAEPAPIEEPAPVPASPPEEPAQKPADANAPAEIVIAPALAPAPLHDPKPARLARGDTLGAVHVSIAIPDTYFQAAHAARERAGQGMPSRAAVEAAEIERIRSLVAQMIPATIEPAGRRVVITSFPTAVPAPPRREAARAQASVPVVTQQSSSQNVSLAELFADFTRSDKRFDARRLPREVWLAGLSVCVGLLAGLLWWLGARGHDAPIAYAVPRRSSHSRIDWSQVDEGSEDDFSDEEPAAVVASRRDRRTAA